MHIDDWAQKWGVSAEAIEDLRQGMGISLENNCKLKDSDKHTESYLSSKLRLEASKIGWRLWRNNVGACFAEDGRLIRYGLANDSSQLNKVLKSADLVGIKPVKITMSMVGTTIGQFVSREVKKSDWKFMGTESEEAQLRWIALVTSLGGDACFTTGGEL